MTLNWLKKSVTIKQYKIGPGGSTQNCTYFISYRISCIQNRSEMTSHRLQTTTQKVCMKSNICLNKTCYLFILLIYLKLCAKIFLAFTRFSYLNTLPPNLANSKKNLIDTELESNVQLE